MTEFCTRVCFVRSNGAVRLDGLLANRFEFRRMSKKRRLEIVEIALTRYANSYTFDENSAILS